MNVIIAIDKQDKVLTNIASNLVELLDKELLNPSLDIVPLTRDVNLFMSNRWDNMRLILSCGCGHHTSLLIAVPIRKSSLQILKGLLVSGFFIRRIRCWKKRGGDNTDSTPAQSLRASPAGLISWILSLPIWATPKILPLSATERFLLKAPLNG